MALHCPVPSADVRLPHGIGDLREGLPVQEQLVNGSHSIRVLIRHQFSILAVVTENAVIIAISAFIGILPQ